MGHLNVAIIPAAAVALRSRARGFTLVELLVVMVIIGVTLGLATLNALPSAQQSLRDDAERIALLLQLARDEAIVRNRQVAFEAEPERYRFLVRNELQWEPVTVDDLLRERPYRHGPLMLSVEPPVSSSPLRITFGREPVDKPFVLTLARGDSHVAIRADGIGHFSVE